MAFWSQQGGGNFDPKRNFRFKVEITNYEDSAVWYAKKATKPSFTVTESTHKFLNHNFYFPGRVEWNTVEVVLVDPIDPDVVATTCAIIEAAGYSVPTKATVNDGTGFGSISKGRTTSAMNGVTITQVDSEGTAVETWVLNQPFIKDVKFGELSYESEDLTEITLELRYDWATCTTLKNSKEFTYTSNPTSEEATGATSTMTGKNSFFS